MKIGPRLRTHQKLLQVANSDMAKTQNAVCHSRRLVDALERLMEDEVYLYHDKMMVKEPRVRRFAEARTNRAIETSKNGKPKSPAEVSHHELPSDIACDCRPRPWPARHPTLAGAEG